MKILIIDKITIILERDPSHWIIAFFIYIFNCDVEYEQL